MTQTIMRVTGSVVTDPVMGVLPNYKALVTGLPGYLGLFKSDREDLTTLSSGRVSAVQDWTGSGPTLSQGTAGNRPLAIQDQQIAPNGRERTLFSFSNARPDVLALSTNFGHAEADASTLWAIVKPSDWATAMIVGKRGAGGGVQRWTLEVGTGGTGNSLFRCRYGNISVTGNGVDPDAWHFVACAKPAGSLTPVLLVNEMFYPGQTPATAPTISAMPSVGGGSSTPYGAATQPYSGLLLQAGFFTADNLTDPARRQVLIDYAKAMGVGT